MVQVFMVLQCFSCKTFQVHQVKKSNKWVCKLCGEKQSVKRVFSEGTGAECRKQVQQLNLMRGEMENLHKVTSDSSDKSTGFHSSDSTVQDFSSNDIIHETGTEDKPSKWKRFISDDECVDDDDDDDCEDMVVTTFKKDGDSWQLRKKRKREKVLVDSRLLHYPTQKQLKCKTVDGNKSSPYGSHVVESMTPLCSFVSEEKSVFSHSLEQENSSSCLLSKNGAHKNYVRSTTDESSSNKLIQCINSTNRISSEQTPKSKDTGESKHQKKTSKWDKYIVDNSDLDETETNSYENEYMHADNVIFGHSSAKSNSSSDEAAVLTEFLSRSSHKLLKKKLPIQSNAVYSSPKAENQSFFQLNDEELENNWWEV